MHYPFVFHLLHDVDLLNRNADSRAMMSLPLSCGAEIKSGIQESLVSLMKLKG